MENQPGGLSERAVGDMFDRIAPHYDFLNRLLSGGQDQRWRRHLVELSIDPAGGRYLDVATGTGDVLAAIGRRDPTARSLVGVDIAPRMLALAKQKTHKSSLQTQLQFLEMSAVDLKFSEASFDTLTIAFGLRNAVDCEACLKEFYRVLSPHGQLLILEFFPPETPNSLSRLFQWYFHQILPRIGGLVSTRQAYEYLPASVERFATHTQLLQQLETLGFCHVSSRSFLWGACRLIQVKKTSHT